MIHTFRVGSSTLKSLQNYEFIVECEEGECLPIGKTIKLINTETKTVKIFKADFIKGNSESERIILRNSNNTLTLVRSI